MRRAASSGFGALTMMAALLVPETAFAQAPPPLPPAASSGGTTSTPSSTATVDNVHLRNGGLYRGHVTEIVPGDHVTVLVEGGESKRIPWAEIDRVIVASTALPPPPATASTPAAAAAAAPATPALPAPMEGPRARVHITSPKNVILYRRPAGSSNWVIACSSPCNQEMPIGDTYHLTGNGVPASKDFRLEANPGGAVDINVDPASTGGMVGGGFLAGTGATAAYVGLLMALIGQGDASDNCYYYSSPTTGGYTDYCTQRKEEGEKTRNAGLITMAVGAAMTVGGILIFVTSAKTDIVQSSGSGKSESGAAKRPPQPLDAFLRQPTWRSTSSSEQALAAPAATIPFVFQRSF